MRISLRTGLAAAILIALGALCFQKVLGFYFVTFDDASHIYRNEIFQHLGWKNYFQFWTKPFEHLYVPVTYSFWSLGVLLAGKQSLELSPQVFHSFNLFFHLANGLLVFWILRRWSDGLWGRFLGAAFFMLHPFQVEAVAWISALKDVICVFWSLASLELFLTWTESNRSKHLVLTSVFYLLALLSKPWAVILPIIFVILSRLSSPRSKVIQKVAAIFFAAGAGVVAVTKGGQPDSEIMFQVAWWERGRVALDAFAFYLLKLFVPRDFTVNYGRNPEVALQSDLYLYGLIAIAVLGVIAWRKAQWRGILLTTFGVFFVSLLPTSGLVSFFFQKYSTVSDRFAYFAVLGPAILLAWIVDKKRDRGFVLLGVLLVGFLAVRSHLLLRHWQDDTALVARTARVAPRADHSFNLAQMISLEMEGKNPVPGTAPRLLAPPRSEREKRLWLKMIELNYREAIGLRPDFAEAYHGLGITLAQSQKWPEAIAALREAVRMSPAFAMAWYSLGQVYEAAGKKEWARESYKTALEVDPSAVLAKAKLKELEKSIRTSSK